MTALALLTGERVSLRAWREEEASFGPGRQSPGSSISFIRPPFVHPKIIQDLHGSIADSGEHVVAINVLDSQDSNRYFGAVKIRDIPTEAPFVFVRGNNEEFGYQHVGTTDSGVHILFCSDWGGGSGIFNSVIFVVFERDRGIVCDRDELRISSDRERLLIRKLGRLELGDRWGGELRLNGDWLLVGKDSDRRFKIEIDR